MLLLRGSSAVNAALVILSNTCLLTPGSVLIGVIYLKKSPLHNPVILSIHIYSVWGYGHTCGLTVLYDHMSAPCVIIYFLSLGL